MVPSRILDPVNVRLGDSVLFVDVSRGTLQEEEVLLGINYAFALFHLDAKLEGKKKFVALK
jgi:hypothetical protein